MHIERTRENVFTVTATGQELSSLIGGARMALEVMQHASADRTPPEALEHLERVLDDFDRSRARMTAAAPAEE
jgi:hypothetical protein